MSNDPEVDWWFIDLYITIRCPCGEGFESSCQDTSDLVCPNCNTRYQLKTKLVKYKVKYARET